MRQYVYRICRINICFIKYTKAQIRFHWYSIPIRHLYFQCCFFTKGICFLIRFNIDL